MSRAAAATLCPREALARFLLALVLLAPLFAWSWWQVHAGSSSDASAGPGR